MTREIRLLDSLTIDRIAAGEVIENASSVVKELVENALDSGADNISVETVAGGQGSVVVSDNGCGMSEADILLALERHATSKIRDFDDLYSLESLGFRGEALPSIASISRMEITSSQEGEMASIVTIDGGKVRKCDVGIRSVGTTVSVASLFYNVPARKKFQKHPNSDKMKIRKLMEGMMLSWDQVGWRWVSDGQEELVVRKDMSFEDRVSIVMGEAFMDRAIPIHGEDDKIVISGFLGSPECHRPSRQGQRVFLNNRIVEMPLLGYRVEEACGTLLPPRRFPVFVFRLKLPHDWCDVNVHPQKALVRVREEQKLGSFIHSTIVAALSSCSKTVYFSSENSLEASFTRGGGGLCLEKSWPAVLPRERRLPKENEPQQDGKDTFASFFLACEKRLKASSRDSSYEGESPRVVPEKSMEQKVLWGESFVRKLSQKGDFLLAEDGEGLHLVRASSANKYLLFYSLMQESPFTLQSQTLLCPVILEITLEEGDLLEEHEKIFSSMGFEVHRIGKTSCEISSIPSSICEEDISFWIFSVLSVLQEGQGDISTEALVKKLLAKSSPRNVIKTFSEENLRLLWSLGKPEKGFDGTLMRRLVLEADLSKWFKIYG